MTLKLRQAVFSPRWHSFWATTYTFDLTGFEEFFLYLLGDSVSATILADTERLERQWVSLLEADAAGWLDRVNRQYLVRGMPWFGHRTFHPKTYFFSGDDGGRLLVGSGNAGIDGLLRGHEVFSLFDSGDPGGLAAIRNWIRWMEHLVTDMDDPTVTGRWRTVLRRSEWLAGPASPGEVNFASNQDRSFLTQLSAAASGPVAELHLAAPFFDARAEAVQRLVATLSPKKVCLYVGPETYVDGPALRSVLEASGADPVIQAYETDDMVHAKLVAAIAGDRGWLLSGSPNLSTAAMLETERSGNCEAWVIARAHADTIRAAFAVPDVQLRSMSLDELTKLTLRTDDADDEVVFPIRLIRAAWKDDRIETVLTTPGDAVPLLRVREAGLPTFLLEELGEHWQTVEPVPKSGRGVLVELVDREERAVSNPVPVDDPAMLEAFASSVEERKAGPPPGMHDSDLDTPVGKLLERLRGACNFDYLLDAQRVRTRINSGTGDVEYWDPEGDLEILEGLRPRRRLATSGRPLDDPVFLDLRTMLSQIPTREQLRVLVNDLAAQDSVGTGTPWTFERRLGVRVFNAVQRWCQAVGDPDAWRDEVQLPLNYVGLLEGLAEIATNVTLAKLLSSDRISLLVRTLFEGFIRSEERPGFLLTLDDQPRQSCIKALEERKAPETAAELLGRLLEPIDLAWRDRALEWKRFLVEGIELGVISTSDAQLSDRLLSAAGHMDDEYWIEQAYKQYRLRVSLPRELYGVDYGGQLRVEEADFDVFADPRLPLLICDLIAYRHATSIVVRGTTPDSWLLSIIPGEQLVVQFRGRYHYSREPVGREELEDLKRAGAPIARLFGEAVASA